VIEFLGEFHFTHSDIAYLAGQRGNDSQPLIDPD